MGDVSQKNGNACELQVTNEFINFDRYPRAQDWLRQLGYPPEVVESVEVVDTSKTKGTYTLSSKTGKSFQLYPVKFSKTDRKIIVTVVGKAGAKYSELISIKSCQSDNGMGCPPQHIARSKLETYIHQWSRYNQWTDEVKIGLALLVGLSHDYLMPEANRYRDRPITDRALLDDFYTKSLRERLLKVGDISSLYSSAVLSFINANKIAIILDALKGRGGLSAEWLLLISGSCTDETKKATAKLVNINDAVNKLASPDFEVNRSATAYSTSTAGITIKRYGGSSSGKGAPLSDEEKFRQGSALQIHLKISELFAGDVPIVDWSTI